MKPMLAYTIEDVSKLKYPCIAQPKIDGVRCYVKDGVCYSRSGKPIRSKAVQDKFGLHLYNGLDGELVYDDATAKDVFLKTTSFVMSKEVPDGMLVDDIMFFVFDAFDKEDDFQSRYKKVESLTSFLSPFSGVLVVENITCNTSEELTNYEHKLLLEGFEGVMVRGIHGLYKHGRSTARAGELGKLKQFCDDEAVVTGFVELMHNENEATADAFGYTERSSSKEGLVPANTLGSLICVCNGITFNIGSGFSAALRKLIWDNKSLYLGKLVKFKYFPVGGKDSFRFPTFIGFRSEDDL